MVESRGGCFIAADLGEALVSDIGANLVGEEFFESNLG